MLLKYTFRDCTMASTYTPEHGKLFNIAHLRANNKADDAVLTSHTEAQLQHLTDHLSLASKVFRLTISLKKINVMAQDTDSPPSITINDYTLKAVNSFLPMVHHLQ